MSVKYLSVDLKFLITVPLWSISSLNLIAKNEYNSKTICFALYYICIFLLNQQQSSATKKNVFTKINNALSKATIYSAIKRA